MRAKSLRRSLNNANMEPRVETAKLTVEFIVSLCSPRVV